jgi:hypothetical protein
MLERRGKRTGLWNLNGPTNKGASYIGNTALNTSNRENQMLRFLVGILSLVTVCNLTVAQSAQPTAKTSPEPWAHLRDFQVIEFRRYTIKEGGREHFAQYFESYFPEAFEQLGAIAAGSFLERGNQTGFTWIRGFHTMDARAVVNAAFYYGPLWREHNKTMNDLMTDSDNVMLLRPLSAEREVTILPAVDPVTEPNGAQGVVVAQIFAVKANSVEAFAKQAETTFASQLSGRGRARSWCAGYVGCDQ